VVLTLADWLANPRLSVQKPPRTRTDLSSSKGRMKPVWTIVEYKGRDGLLRLSPEWMRLVSAMPDAGLRHLLETHIGHIDNFQSSRGELTCLALSDGVRVRAICPVELQQRVVLRRKMLVWGLPLGLGNVPRDVICPPDEEAELALFPCVLEHFRRAVPRRMWFVPSHVLHGSAAWRCLRGLDAGSYSVDVDGAAHFIDCDRPLSDLMSTLSKHFRQNLRTARNRLEATADFRFERAADPSSIATAFEDFVRVESSGWKGHSGTRSALALRPDLLAFYRQLVASLRDTGRCELIALHADGRSIASSVCIRIGHEYTVLKIAYDETYARVSPGQLLFEYVLKQSCADPAIKRVNLVGDPAWSLVWGPEIVACYDVCIATGGWAARALVNIMRARFRYGPVVKRWLSKSRLGERVLQRLRKG
jgi:hypothetical protein